MRSPDKTHRSNVIVTVSMCTMCVWACLARKFNFYSSVVLSKPLNIRKSDRNVINDVTSQSRSNKNLWKSEKSNYTPSVLQTSRCDDVDAAWMLYVAMRPECHCLSSLSLVVKSCQQRRRPLLCGQPKYCPLMTTATTRGRCSVCPTATPIRLEQVHVYYIAGMRDRRLLVVIYS